MSWTLILLHSTVRFFSRAWPLLVYAAVWTLLLLITVGVASSLAQLAYVSALSPSSPPCNAGFVRVPLDVPAEKFCLPVGLMKRSEWDLLVPVVFAALLVSTSAYMIRSVGFWEFENDYY
ncbi:PREDICTED: uncharacterized protein LOC109192876 [Ipomoea nil]|uniref:uncharacterized protein LOC109192876 n=1 Tax=Ipomoea nil TaxID=35883 RepID=UPI0009018B34|nr:PREDICTED: uncharacterized protein LOC109192876 [Ipomoea nil]